MTGAVVPVAGCVLLDGLPPALALAPCDVVAPPFATDAGVEVDDGRVCDTRGLWLFLSSLDEHPLPRATRTKSTPTAVVVLCRVRLAVVISTLRHRLGWPLRLLLEGPLRFGLVARGVFDRTVGDLCIGSRSGTELLWRVGRPEPLLRSISCSSGAYAVSFANLPPSGEGGRLRIC